MCYAYLADLPEGDDEEVLANFRKGEWCAIPSVITF